VSEPALIVIDVQRAFDDAAYWGERDNPACEENIGRLLAHWRAQGWPIVLVRHDSDEDVSPLRPDHPGNAFKDVIDQDGDVLVTKRVNSAFHGDPPLQEWLDGRGIEQLYICGITTNHCCETTARVGGNLGYDVYFVLDATHAFDRPDPAGQIVPAAELSRVTATNLHGEFATVVSTAEALG
jgi:nicotinamidase-related amidase